MPSQMSIKKDLNSYSKDGRIYQIEYAMKASNLGTTTLSMVCKNAVILVSEKKIISKLQNIKELKKHYKIFDNIAISFSGISGDAKAIISKAREFCLSHDRLYKELPPIEGLLQYLCKLALKFGEKEYSKKIFSRPFGVNVLFAGYDDNEPVLFSFDPSGSYKRYKARAIGGASEAVEQEVKENYKIDLELEDALVKSLAIVKKVMKDSINCENVEVCVVDENGIEFYNQEKIDSYIKKI